MQIREALQLGRITLHIARVDRAAALAALATAFARRDPALDEHVVRIALEQREALGSTNMGHGVAIPHARLDGMEAPRLAVAIARGGIDYGGGEPVHILVGLLSDPDRPDVHLDALATLSRVLGDADVRAQLLVADTPQHVIEILAAAQLVGPRRVGTAKAA